MQETRYYLAHVLMAVEGGNRLSDVESVKLAARAALESGVGAKIRDFRLYRVEKTTLDPSNESCETTECERVIEEYEHCGMRVQIFSSGGGESPTQYFAVVVNPNVKSPSGALLEATDTTSLSETKKLAEARAVRKAELLARAKKNRDPE